MYWIAKLFVALSDFLRWLMQRPITRIKHG
jgi:hypothetical protein